MSYSVHDVVVSVIRAGLHVEAQHREGPLDRVHVHARTFSRRAHAWIEGGVIEHQAFPAQPVAHVVVGRVLLHGQLDGRLWFSTVQREIFSNRKRHQWVELVIGKPLTRVRKA